MEPEALCLFMRSNQSESKFLSLHFVFFNVVVVALLEERGEKKQLNQVVSSWLEWRWWKVRVEDQILFTAILTKET